MFISRNEYYIGGFCSKSKNMEDIKMILNARSAKIFILKGKKRQKRGHFFIQEDATVEKEDKRGQTA